MQSTYTWVAPPTLSSPPPKFPNLNAKLSTTTAAITTLTPPKLTKTNSSEEADRFPLPLAHVKSITSTSNPFVKHCLKLLHNSSYRHSHGSVLVVGSTPIRYTLFFYFFCKILLFKCSKLNLGGCYFLVLKLNVAVLCFSFTISVRKKNL